MLEDREKRRHKLRDELRTRLERVRGAMTNADFESLVRDVERVAARFDEIDASPSRVGPGTRFG